MDYNALAKQYGAVSSQPASAKGGKIDYSALAKQYGAVDSKPSPKLITPSQTPSQPQSGGIGGFLKGLVSAPATLLARPFQASAELLGASDQDVNNFSNKISGGLIAPTPQNFGDVGKDVGRAAETVALGAGGPIAGGALFGAGNSLEQGNNLFSTQTALQTALGAAGGKALDLVGKPLLDAAGKVIGKITPQTIQDVVSKGTSAIQDFAKNHSILPESVSKPLNSVNEKIGGLGVKPPTPQAKISTDLTDLQDRISPKPTVREARLAQTEGRLVKGKPATLFKSGTEDTIIPTNKTIQTAKTIAKNIPNHSDLSDPELYDALDSKSTQIAKNLQPKMEKVPVDPETIRKINSDYQTVKQSQSQNPYISKDVNLKNLQDDFSSRLKNSKIGSLDDLWTTRKAYDASVPSNVKNANTLSSESLQNKRDIWLQNRKVLNDAINDTKFGLGKTSQKAFSDMTDMYGGKESLLSKAKVETKVQPSKLSQAYHSKTGKVLRTIGSAGLGVEALKQVID